ncbi:MAG: HlyD family efflux transporter periplasmic adaptor subunit [Bacteroidales bacterium]|jgi:multidrug resistance efflux pump|nr:HlyD family efflux transporter periplasmic adaptor subunit [Bacteroidales bacterium]
MSDEKGKIELRSDEVEDILGKVPTWVTRNGILMFFIVISLLLIGTWAFKIPDVKKANISVTSLQPAIDIEARMDGKVDILFVSDNEEVKEQQVLAVIEKSAVFEDVVGLKDKLEMLDPSGSKIEEMQLPANGNAILGVVQGAYATFYKNYRDYAEFLQLNYHQRKIELLVEENTQYMAYSENLDERASILREEYDLSYKQYNRDSSLYKEGVVSESAYEDTKSKMLSKRGGWQQILSLKTENEIKIAGIREQILEMELKKQERLSQFSSSLEEALNNLNASIASWEKQYLIVTPISGHVTFNKIWSENQNVKAGERVMTVIPYESSDYLGKIMLPLKGAGEVKEGQQVNIRFDNFPYLEYGMVKGEVSNISKVSQDKFYTVEVSLPNGLITYYGVKIDFSQNMQGQVEILTDKMRLLTRIFNPVRNAISRQREM